MSWSQYPFIKQLKPLLSAKHSPFEKCREQRTPGAGQAECSRLTCTLPVTFEMARFPPASMRFFMFFSLYQSHQRSALQRNGGHAGSIVLLPDMLYCVTMETDSFICSVAKWPRSTLMFRQVKTRLVSECSCPLPSAEWMVLHLNCQFK